MRFGNISNGQMGTFKAMGIFSMGRTCAWEYFPIRTFKALAVFPMGTFKASRIFPQFKACPRDPRDEIFLDPDKIDMFKSH